MLYKVRCTLGGWGAIFAIIPRYSICSFMVFKSNENETALYNIWLMTVHKSNPKTNNNIELTTHKKAIDHSNKIQNPQRRIAVYNSNSVRW